MKVMLPEPYKGRCVFCGRSDDLSNEHIISKTVRKLQPKTANVTTVVGVQKINRDSTLNIVLEKAICMTCNGGWMRELEDDFVRILGTQLSLPVEVRVDPANQERIATWAIKVALLMQLFTSTRANQERGHFIPGSHLRWLWKHQKLSGPPPGTRVWIGMVNDPQWLVRLQPSSLAISRGNPPDAYFVSLSLGYLLFHVFGVEFVNRESKDLRTLELPRELTQTLVEIWPGTGMDLVWPTPQLIQAAHLSVVDTWPSVSLGLPNERVTYSPQFRGHRRD